MRTFYALDHKIKYIGGFGTYIGKREPLDYAHYKWNSDLQIYRIVLLITLVKLVQL